MDLYRTVTDTRHPAEYHADWYGESHRIIIVTPQAPNRETFFDVVIKDGVKYWKKIETRELAQNQPLVVAAPA